MREIQTEVLNVLVNCKSRQSTENRKNAIDHKVVNQRMLL